MIDEQHFNNEDKGILIVTFSRNCNLGGALQEFALYAFLKNYRKVKCLNYRNELAASLLKPIRIGFLIKAKMIVISTTKSFFKKKSDATKEEKHASLLSPRLLLKEIVERLYLMLSDIVHFGQRKRMIKNYLDFWNNYVQYTDEFTDWQLKDEDVIKKLFGDYDVCISGSDQIWNPVYVGVSPIYFLGFVQSGTKKASYASSFGNYKFSSETLNSRIATYLSDFYSIGVRENYSVKHLKDKCNIQAKCVLDPTLLLSKDEWCKLLGAELSGRTPFLLVYALGNRRVILPFAKRVGQHLNLNVVVIDTKFFLDFRNSSFEYVPSAGPKELIELYSQASFVIANSFHGTAFAVNFNIPFFSFESRTGERAKAFLETVKLSDRLISDCKNVDLSSVEMDFTHANKILAQEREQSIEYLEKIINLNAEGVQ